MARRRRTGPRAGSRPGRRGRARRPRRCRTPSRARGRARARRSAAARIAGGPGVRRRAAGRVRRAGGAHDRARARPGGAGRAARSARPRAGRGRARRGTPTWRATAVGLEHHSTSKRGVDGAELDAVAGAAAAAAPLTRMPLTITPLVEPRSSTVQLPSAANAIRGVVARDVGVVEHDVAVAAAADHRAGRRRSRSACPRRRGSRGRGRAAFASASSSWTRCEDEKTIVRPVARRARARRAPPPRSTCGEARLDPELAEASRSSVRNSITRAADEREPLARGRARAGRPTARRRPRARSPA